jgi:hypothetical protein
LGIDDLLLDLLEQRLRESEPKPKPAADDVQKQTKTA